jgi:hypothetical protein
MKTKSNARIAMRCTGWGELTPTRRLSCVCGAGEKCTTADNISFRSIATKKPT